MDGQARRIWGHKVYQAGEIGGQYMCDLCDQITPLGDIHRIEEPVYLCPNCYRVISAMPEGKIKNSVMRFLTRNVI